MKGKWSGAFFRLCCILCACGCGKLGWQMEKQDWQSWAEATVALVVAAVVYLRAICDHMDQKP